MSIARIHAETAVAAVLAAMTLAAGAALVVLACVPVN